MMKDFYRRARWQAYALSAMRPMGEIVNATMPTFPGRVAEFADRMLALEDERFGTEPLGIEAERPRSATDATSAPGPVMVRA